MKAIQVEDGRLVWQTVDAPTVGIGDVLIDVAASAVNRADIVQRQGGYPPPPGASPILGLECSGVVSAVGEGVTRVQPGDKVCALLAGGGYAEQVVVPAGQVLKIPAGLTFAEAAAIPEVFATAYLNLYSEAGLTTGERVVVHAGASGVGTAALQLCRQSHNPTFVTVSGQRKIDACIGYGAEAGWDRQAGSFVDAVRDWAGDPGVQVILDPVGASYLADNMNVAGVDGRIVLIGLMGGATTDVNLGLLLMKRIRLIGSTLRARSISAKSKVMDDLERVVWPALESGAIKPVIEDTVPMAEAQRAHELVEGNDTVGKVILTLRS